MQIWPLLCLNAFYLVLLPAAALLYGLIFTGPLLAAHLLGGRRFEDAIRVNNRLFGAFLIRMAWPLIRARRLGLENIPPDLRPCVIVLNHRSFADIFFCGLLPFAQLVVLVRAWPFRLWPFGWFMRRARYINIEQTPMGQLTGQIAPELARRGVSFAVFPEGHRSRDGRLQRFHGGAFLLAAEQNLPILPACLSGTERLTGGRWPLLRPARVTLEFLPLVYPGSFPEEKRALRLKRTVEGMFKTYFGE